VIEPNPPIYFIRHGETDWNREGRIQGQIDIPLNDAGHQQAVAISRGLKNFLGNSKVDLFVASPLTRTRQTMGYLSREFGMSVRPNHLGIALQRHRRAGRLENRDQRWYTPQSGERRQPEKSATTG